MLRVRRRVATAVAALLVVALFAPAASAQRAAHADAGIAAPSTAVPPLEAPAIPAAPVAEPRIVFEGKVSYYARAFVGRSTANGERYDPAAPTMAHKTLPFGTLVRVTNLRNDKTVVLRVNDRGPHVAGRVGDVSASAAGELGMLQSGVVDARFEVLREPPAP